MLEVKIGSASFSLSLPDWMTATSDSWLSDHQVLVGGLIGFTGVCVSVFSTAWLQSRARKSERLHRANSIRVALSAELREIKGSWVSLIEDVKNESISDTQCAHMDRERYDSIFVSMRSDIGFLTEEEVSAVVEAYSAYGSGYGALQLFSVKYSHPTHFKLDVASATLASVVLEKCEEKVSAAIQLLEKNTE